MERSNQPPKTEDCLAAGEPVDLWFPPERTAVEKRIHGKARAASWTRIRLKQFSLEKLNRKRRWRLTVRIQNQPVR